MEQAWCWGLSEAIANNGSVERAPGSGRPRTTRTAENVDAVGDLVQSQKNQPPDTPLHSTDRMRARNTSSK